MATLIFCQFIGILTTCYSIDSGMIPNLIKFTMIQNQQTKRTLDVEKSSNLNFSHNSGYWYV